MVLRPHRTDRPAAANGRPRSDGWAAALAAGVLCIAACEYSHLVYLARIFPHRRGDLSLLALDARGGVPHSSPEVARSVQEPPVGAAWGSGAPGDVAASLARM
jgi:hypothetical protein